jgi:ATP-dependent exoDNAse (exonuclease V) beta subunit
MHQEAKRKYDGYFHMQFFDSKTYDEDALNALIKQIQGFQQENIDLSRVTILTRYSRESEKIANHLIQHGYSVQSSEGLRIGSHIAVQIIVQLLKLSITEENTARIYLRDSVEDIEQYAESIAKARKLALYDHVQALIDILNLHKREGATPYLTAFQDLIFKFSQTKVADTQLFLKYWEQKEKKATIPAPKTNNAITIMTIHSSKGLEFDIVIIPFFNWALEETHTNDIIWCAPHIEPFNTLPLVPVHPSPTLLRSYLDEDYIQEDLAKYTDNLNLTYVAITRPRYRLYLYGPMFTTKKKEIQINNVGNLFAHLVANQMDDNHIFTSDGLPELPPKDPETVQTAETTYISVPIKRRLVLSSQKEKSIEQNDVFDMTQLGNMMHLWLANIRTWKDAQPALQRLIINGDITTLQAQEMQEELKALQQLISDNQHDDWFSGEYHIFTEQDIIAESGKAHRPDRVLIKNQHAIVIDYKFGYIESPSYTEQIRDYMLLLRSLGYTSEGYIIYNQSHKIQVIQ